VTIDVSSKHEGLLIKCISAHGYCSINLRVSNVKKPIQAGAHAVGSSLLPRQLHVVCTRSKGHEQPLVVAPVAGTARYAALTPAPSPQQS
jgi:hypothetical protein